MSNVTIQLSCYYREFEMSLIRHLKEYLFESLGLKVQISVWGDEEKLPFFLRGIYTFYEAKILNKSYVLMAVRVEEEISPVKVSQHRQLVKQLWSGEVVYVHHLISPYNRKALIKGGLSFVIPGTQMYLSDLAFSVRERFQRQLIIKKQFKPATQALVLFFLIHAEKGKYNPAELSKKLGYSKMSLTRAFDELEDAGIFEMLRKGRERGIYFSGDRQSLWEEVKAYLRSPVRKKVFIAKGKAKEGTVAGLTALANFSSLNLPKVPVFALNRKRFSQELESHTVKYPEEAGFELELWDYDPALTAKQNVADPFSTFLSLRDEDDERIELALDEMMEQVKW
ncbi:Uncharacterized protein SCG7109_AH_00050 [Chlamydiales bacterium SCGC AG-110-M15]|nr:Uncharacterized protein SCG7109_AH_00050 [Chlamydiales bacterium SCGC AG-110-M15]